MEEHEVIPGRITSFKESEPLRVKCISGKGGILQCMAVPASTPYSREEREIEKEMKNFIYAEKIVEADFEKKEESGHAE